MQIVCGACEKPFESMRPNARWCSDRCRKRSGRSGQVVSLHGREPAGKGSRSSAPSSPRGVVGLESSTLAESTLAELERVGRQNSSAGVAALIAARRLDSPGTDTGSSVAALLKAHREALAEALRDVAVEDDPVGRIRESAALKLLAGA